MRYKIEYERQDKNRTTETTIFCTKEKDPITVIGRFERMHGGKFKVLSCELRGPKKSAPKADEDCEFCHTTDEDNINYGPINICGNQAEQENYCLCGNKFYTIYKYSHKINV